MSAYQMYCRVASDLPLDLSVWKEHRDAKGQPIGTLFSCVVGDFFTKFALVYRWSPDPPVTPPRAGSDPVVSVRSAIAALGLHPPAVGVGAYVYRGYTEWGLTWWVGAPMWLWIDRNDPLQWGTHTVTASVEGGSVTATVKAVKVEFDPGDGGGPVVCLTPGTSRPWDPNDLLEDHSPSNCEYRYPHTNKLGDKNSRFSVSASVTWDVRWSSSDGQYGVFSFTVDSVESPSVHVGELRVVAARDPTPMPTPSTRGPGR